MVKNVYMTVYLKRNGVICCQTNENIVVSKPGLAGHCNGSPWMQKKKKKNTWSRHVEGSSSSSLRTWALLPSQERYIFVLWVSVHPLKRKTIKDERGGLLIALLGLFSLCSECYWSLRPCSLMGDCKLVINVSNQFATCRSWSLSGTWGGGA